MFNEGDTSLDVSADEPFPLNVKSIALLHQAARIAACTRALRTSPIGDSPNNPSSLHCEAHALSIGLPEFIRTLAIQRQQAQIHGRYFAFLASVMTTALGASMELHSIDAMFDQGSYDAMIRDVMMIAELALETEAFDPILLGPVVGVSDEDSYVLYITNMPLHSLHGQWHAAR